MKKTLVVGSNGTADTTWVVDVQMTSVKSNVGVLCADTLHRSRSIVVYAIWAVAANNDKLCSIGRMIHEESDCWKLRLSASFEACGWYLTLILYRSFRFLTMRDTESATKFFLAKRWGWHVRSRE